MRLSYTLIAYLSWWTPRWHYATGVSDWTLLAPLLESPTILKSLRVDITAQLPSLFHRGLAQTPFG